MYLPAKLAGWETLINPVKTGFFNNKGPLSAFPYPGFFAGRE